MRKKLVAGSHRQHRTLAFAQEESQHPTFQAAQHQLEGDDWVEQRLPRVVMERLRPLVPGILVLQLGQLVVVSWRGTRSERQKHVLPLLMNCWWPGIYLMCRGSTTYLRNRHRILLSH